MEAFNAAAKGEKAQSDDGRKQLAQLHRAVHFRGDQLRSFISRIVLTGRMERLGDIECANARTIADWSASNDVPARARLGVAPGAVEIRRRLG